MNVNYCVVSVRRVSYSLSFEKFTEFVFANILYWFFHGIKRTCSDICLVLNCVRKLKNMNSRAAVLLLFEQPSYVHFIFSHCLQINVRSNEINKQVHMSPLWHRRCTIHILIFLCYLTGSNWYLSGYCQQTIEYFCIKKYIPNQLQLNWTVCKKM
jgi:hypothetical protein